MQVKHVAALLAVVLTGSAVTAEHRPGPSGPSGPAWATAWAMAPTAAETGTGQGLAGYTIRDVVHLTAAGNRVRVHLSNRFGTAPVLFGHITVALSAHTGGRRDGTIDPSDGSAQAGGVRDALFDGVREFTLAAGAEAVSDPVDLPVAADRDLLVSVWTPAPSGTVTYHPVSAQDSVVSPGPEDHAADTAATAFTGTSAVWQYVDGVDVSGPPGTVAVLGDSITDGPASTRGANHRWTDYLAARLASSPAPDYAVANSGASGNRLLLDGLYPNYTIYATSGPSAQARLPEDVLDRAGVRTVILFEGVNDIQQAPIETDPRKIIAGLAQLATRAHAAGLRVVGATITPFEGWKTWTPAMEPVRAAVNAWILAGGDGKLDAIADFDAALRDPADPQHLNPAFDSGDHLHPNDAGNSALAKAVPLSRL
jgi:lysophospholipase L1-like esterase